MQLSDTLHVLHRGVTAETFQDYCNAFLKHEGYDAIADVMEQPQDYGHAFAIKAGKQEFSLHLKWEETRINGVVLNAHRCRYGTVDRETTFTLGINAEMQILCGRFFGTMACNDNTSVRNMVNGFIYNQSRAYWKISNRLRDWNASGLVENPEQALRNEFARQRASVIAAWDAAENALISELRKAQ